MNTEYHNQEKKPAATVRVVDFVKTLRTRHTNYGTLIRRRPFLCPKCLVTHVDSIPERRSRDVERVQKSWIPLPLYNASHLPTETTSDTTLTRSDGADISDNVDKSNTCVETEAQELQRLTNALDAIADWIDNRPHTYGR